jgi:hypothetical protein
LSSQEESSFDRSVIVSFDFVSWLLFTYLQAALKALWLPEQDRRRRLERFLLAVEPSSSTGLMMNPQVQIATAAAAAAIKAHVYQRLRGELAAEFNEVSTD